VKLDIYRCKECNWVCNAEKSGAIGTAHAHAEKHTSFWKLPAWLMPSANPDKLDKSLEIVTVEIPQGGCSE